MEIYKTNDTAVAARIERFKNKYPASRSLDALNDFYSSLVNWRVWVYMAFADTRRRYRRTVIGPFWTSLNLAIFIFCMGFLLSNLWKQDVRDFLPYFCSGYITWSLISTIISEGCNTFISSEPLLKQLPMPFCTFAFFTVCKNYVVFLHHLLILGIIMLIFQVPVNLNTLLVIPGFLLVFITGSWITALLGMLCARFRDIEQVITSLLQLAIYVTPIFWRPEQLNPQSAALAELNPLYHLVSVIRSPLIGQAPSKFSYVFVISLSLIGWMITFRALAKSYRKLIYWL